LKSLTNFCVKEPKGKEKEKLEIKMRGTRQFRQADVEWKRIRNNWGAACQNN
jgi:hypothetical protein